MNALVKYAQKRLSMNQSNKSYKHSSFDSSHGHFVIQCLTLIQYFGKMKKMLQLYIIKVQNKSFEIH